MIRALRVVMAIVGVTCLVIADALDEDRWARFAADPESFAGPWIDTSAGEL